MKRNNLEDAYLSSIYNKASELEKSYLAHHGILGQKWGIRRFQNYDGTRTAEGKERYNNLNKEENLSIDEKFEKNGYKKDAYGCYKKDISDPNNNIKKLRIRADVNSGFGYKLNEDEYFKLLDNIEKNYNSLYSDMAKNMADYFFDNGSSFLPWDYEERTEDLNILKNEFINKFGTQPLYKDGETIYTPGYNVIRVMNDGLGEYSIDDGGAFYGHWLTTEVDWREKKHKIVDVSVEG